jgi:hypothetical protein
VSPIVRFILRDGRCPATWRLQTIAQRALSGADPGGVVFFRVNPVGRVVVILFLAGSVIFGEIEY